MATKFSDRKKKLGGSSKSSGDSLRDKFKKRDKNILEKTYNEREERSQAGGGGKSPFNQEVLKELGIEEFRNSEGDNYFEILPVSYDPSVPYSFDIAIHFSVGFASDAFVCMSRFSGKPCYRCEQQAKMYKTLPKGNKPTKEIKALYPTDRAVYLLYDRTKELAEEKEPEYKLKIYAAPKTKIHAEIQVKARDKRKKQSFDITDVNEDGEGKTINYEYQSNKNKPDSYPEYTAVQLLKREDPIPDEVLELLDEFITKTEELMEETGANHPLEVLFHYPEYDEVKESMESEGAEEEEEEKPRGRARLGKKEKEEKEEKEESGLSEEEIVEKLEELKEELDGMKTFKFKKWCKENNMDKYVNMEDRDEAVEYIIDKMYERMTEVEEDDIPF